MELCRSAMALGTVMIFSLSTALATPPETVRGFVPVPIAWGKPVDGIQVGLSCSKSVYGKSAISPIWVNVWLRGNRSSPATLQNPNGLLHGCKLVTEAKGGNPVPETSFGKKILIASPIKSPSAATIHLRRGQKKLDFRFRLNQLFDMSSDSRYRIRLKMPLARSNSIWSNWLTVSIKRPVGVKMSFSGASSLPKGLKPKWGKPIAGIEAAITTDKHSYSPCEPIKVRVWLRNIGDRPVNLLAETSGLGFTPAGLTPTRVPARLTTMGFAVLHPSTFGGGAWITPLPSEHQGAFSSFVANKLFDMSVPGKYRIFIKFPVPTKPHFHGIKNAISNTLHITITDAAPDAKPKDPGPVKPKQVKK